jgi:hypothetical protein
MTKGYFGESGMAKSLNISNPPGSKFVDLLTLKDGAPMYELLDSFPVKWIGDHPQIIPFEGFYVAGPIEKASPSPIFFGVMD